MGNIEIKRIIHREVINTHAHIPYSSEPLVREIVIGSKILKSERTLSRKERRRLKNQALGRITGIPDIDL